MYSLLILAVSSFFICVFLTFACRELCLRFGLVDHPDSSRKLHARPIPRLGGVSIALSYVTVITGLMLLRTEGGGLVERNLDEVWRLIPAFLVVFLTGLLDDLRDLRAWQKVAGQIGGAVLAFGAGVRVTQLGGMELPMPVQLALTVVWIVGCTNAFNLVDGMDGLAAGLGFFAALTTFVAAMLQDNFALAIATAPLVACLLAFLAFNFNPASIFLGDSGSLLVGFMLACYAVIWSQKTATLFGVAAPLMALAIPLADTTLAVVRRYLRNRPIFSADRGHIHHLLLDRGFTPRCAALMLYGVAGVGAALAILPGIAEGHLAGAALVTFCVLLLIGIHSIHLVELQTFHEMIRRGTFRRIVGSHIALHAFERALMNAENLDQRWDVLRNGASDFGFVRICLCVGDQTFNESFRHRIGDQSWHMRVPLGGSDHVDLQYDQHYTGLSMIGPFVEVVGRQMQLRQTVSLHLRARSATAHS